MFLEVEILEIMLAEQGYAITTYNRIGQPNSKPNPLAAHINRTRSEIKGFSRLLSVIRATRSPPRAAASDLGGDAAGDEDTFSLD